MIELVKIFCVTDHDTIKYIRFTNNFGSNCPFVKTIVDVYIITLNTLHQLYVE